MNKLAAVMMNLLALVLRVIFILFFITGFLVLSAVLSVFTVAVRLRGWYWEKRYG